jgi:hypothetical protein
MVARFASANKALNVDKTHQLIIPKIVGAVQQLAKPNLFILVRKWTNTS